jgi:tRNA(fMet)-specific endonuclease VapC
LALIVADTDVLIDALRGRDPVAKRVAEEIKAGNLATTVLSCFELLSGSRDDGERERVGDLLEALRVLPLDPEAAELAAALRRQLEARGETIGLADYLIAGICQSRSAALMTRNRRHFDRVPRLQLV